MPRVLQRVLLAPYPHDITICPGDDSGIADDTDMVLFDLKQVKRKWLLLDSRVVDLSRSPNLIVVTLCSLKLSFFNGLKKGIALLGQRWSLRPWNPIRASCINASAEGKNGNMDF